MLQNQTQTLLFAEQAATQTKHKLLLAWNPPASAPLEQGEGISAPRKNPQG